MNIIRNPPSIILALLVSYSVLITGWVSPRYPSMRRLDTSIRSTSKGSMSRSDNIMNLKSKNIWKTIWDRMDTLESAGFTNSCNEQQQQQLNIRQGKKEVTTSDSNNKPYYPPLVARGGGFKRFMIIMAFGMAYKWYRARFINKIPFWEKQPQWNMVVTTKEQEDALRAYTCLNCGATLFIARNREWFFEGGTGLSGLGCYSCGAKGKDNFVMDRSRIVEEVGDEDDYFSYERPLDFVSAAERKALLRATKGDEAAANQMLIEQQQEATKQETAPPPPIFGVLPEDVKEDDDDKDVMPSKNDENDDKDN